MLDWHDPKRTQQLFDALATKIMVLDGAMGTMIQSYSPSEEDYRGERFINHPSDLKGNNDLLSITQPNIVEEIHRQFLDAGCDFVETNTFNANRISQADYALESLSYELNLASAQLAKQACDEAQKHSPDQPRFVIGVLGPTNRTASISPDVASPGYRNVTFDQLAEAYQEALKGLLDGGSDLIMIETVFDTLNAKAAIYAVEEEFQLRGVRWPLMISGTITDASGRTLSGQTAEAFYFSVAHANPISVGFNCALGADQLKPHIKALSGVAQCLVSAHPNAGLPNELGEYDESPSDMASVIETFAKDGLINIIGGCCGTTPAHLKAIIDAVKPYSPRRLPDDLSEALSA